MPSGWVPHPGRGRRLFSAVQEEQHGLVGRGPLFLLWGWCCILFVSNSLVSLTLGAKQHIALWLRRLFCESICLREKSQVLASPPGHVVVQVALSVLLAAAANMGEACSPIALEAQHWWSDCIRASLFVS